MPCRSNVSPQMWQRYTSCKSVLVCLRMLQETECALLAQVVPICVPDLELVRVAQILTISSEMCQAYKFAMANSKLRKQFNMETRVSLAAAARFTATDYLQVMSNLGASWVLH